MTLIDWLVMAGLGYLGYKMFVNPTRVNPPRPHPDIGRHLAAGPILKRVGPGDVIQVANGSPYAYEPDGNYL